MKKRIIKIILILLCLGILGCATVFGIDAYIRHTSSERILSPEDAAALDDVDCILVLGCLVRDGGRPSDMLADRLQRGLALFSLGAAPKLLMSGDHGRVDYNEVGAMKQHAIDAGVASSDIFMDHAGFSTYESLYRAKHIFGADKIIIVTQQYHLYRALHTAKSLGIEAYGVSSDYHRYAGQAMREIREILARVKDFATGIFKPEPTYLGETIPISGDGDLTND